MTGPLTRPIVAFTKATSSAVVLRPYCAAIHSYPSAWRGTISLLKHEPSAQSPWQKTILGFACLILFSFAFTNLCFDGTGQGQTYSRPIVDSCARALLQDFADFVIFCPNELHLSAGKRD